MPQMMPMNWIFMFIMLNSMLLVTMIILFNNTTNNFSDSTSETSNSPNSWGW